MDTQKKTQRITINTITFHRAQNYGSVLQTYALKRYITNLLMTEGYYCDYKIIDYYSYVQRKLYSIFRCDFSLKSIVKNFVALIHYPQLLKRQLLFDKFIDEHLELTCEYHTETELEQNKPIADIYISGSDQIWNVRATDFSPVYYLSFLKKAKCISYAASFGPLKINWEKYDSSKYADLLNKYDYISTRETGSADNVEQLTGKRPEVHVDPTFLLSVDEWREVQSKANYNKGKYILFYCLEPTREQIKIASAISKKISLPILVLRYNNKNDWFNSFVHRYDAGPSDFLSYIDNAAMVLSSSFHGTAFSIIYHKPFYVFNGLNDNRISSILTKMNLEDRLIEKMDDIDKVEIKPLDGEIIENALVSERERSTKYLKTALGIR